MVFFIVVFLILGFWLDRVGCKIVLIFFFVGSVLFYINYMLNVGYFLFDVNFIFIGVCILGFFGGFVIIFFGVFFYIFDIFDKFQCILRVVILEFMIFLGGMVGNLIGGVLVEYQGFMVVFGLCLGLNVIVIFYVSLIFLEFYFFEENQEGNWVLVVVYNYFKVCF